MILLPHHTIAFLLFKNRVENTKSTLKTMDASISANTKTQEELIEEAQDETAHKDPGTDLKEGQPSTEEESFLEVADEFHEFSVGDTHDERADLTQLLKRTKATRGSSFYQRVGHPIAREGSSHRDHDRYNDFFEKKSHVLQGADKDIQVSSLAENRSQLVNKEKERYQQRAKSGVHLFLDLLTDTLAAIYIYLAHTVSLEAVLYLLNAVGGTYFFIARHEDYATKLDFAFLAFSVVFPLTFLIQATFSRREAAALRLADFKSCILSTILFTLTVDWPIEDGSKRKNLGRLSLPDNFNEHVIEDAKELVFLVYEYLSMPNVLHARNVVFSIKQKATRRTHAFQNDIVVKINNVMFDFAMHTELMREYGFPSGECSRRHQYVQYLRQRFEQLRLVKYYRTPQATRSFGSVYILVLPWVCGPYFAWVYEETSLAFALCLAGFTFAVLLGLLHTQQGLEDPFLSNYSAWLPGIDNVKLELEFASALQALDQHYANAELRRQFQLKHLKLKK